MICAQDYTGLCFKLFESLGVCACKKGRVCGPVVVVNLSVDFKD